MSKSKLVQAPTHAPFNPANRLLTEYGANRALEYSIEILKRRSESLRIYEPMPSQLEFHKSQAPERLARGSNQAGKAQPIDEPVLTPEGWVAIGALRVGDEVIGGDGKPCRVTGVFPQGVKPVNEIVFDDGSTTRCCDEHLWKCKIGTKRFGKSRLDDNWQVLSTEEIFSLDGNEPRPVHRAVVPAAVVEMPQREVPIDPYLLGVMLGDGTMRHSPMLATADGEIVESVRSRLPEDCRLEYRSKYDYAIRGTKHGLNPMLTLLRSMGLWGKLSQDKFIPDEYKFNSVEVRLALLRGLMDTDGSISAKRTNHVGGTTEFCTTSPALADDVAYLVRSLGGKCRVSWRETQYTYKGEKKSGRPSARLKIRMQGFNPFALTRKSERYHKTTKYAPTRVMRSLHPQGQSECVCIAVDSPDHTYVTRDCIVTHNTLAAAVEVAWAATGQHPYRNYPKGNMEIYLVAKDEKQIGEVWWRKLAMPGPFEAIRDKATGMFRAYRPWDEDDKSRKHERVPAEPLIPQRFWDGEPAWNKQNLGIPRMLKLKNGTRIHFFTGNARPPHGTQIHMAAFDEEIGSQLWYSEIAARLLRFNGAFIWSATPQAATEGLYDLHMRADQEASKETPAVTEHFLHIAMNAHIDDEAKAVLLGKLTDPEQKRVRWDGEYAGSQLHIFPEWNINIHGVDFVDEDGKPLQIPKDWTRYMVVDPGHATCAVLFAAVPPKEFGDYIYLYDELYIQPCFNADYFAERVEKKIQDDVFYEFIVDSHGGRATEQGTGLTVEQQYSRALARRKIRSQTTGSSFIWGMDDVQSGNMAIHDWLNVRADTGDPKLRVLKGRLPNFEFEIQRYRKKRAPDGTITDKPYDKYDHLISCLRYLRGRNPKWHKSKASKPAKKPDGLDLLNALKAKSRKKYGQDYINLGPGQGHQLVGTR